MELIISTSSASPIYEQITTQIKAKIMAGELPAGSSLPSIRALAKTLHISVITVQRAYDDLARAGLIETTIGKGTFVAGINKEFFREEQLKKVEAHLEQAVELARSSGIELGTLQQLLELFYQEGEGA